MSALESLSNPLERLATLPTAVQARSNGAGDITWDATLQYFRGDLAISSLDGGAYVFTGGTFERSSVLGGSDPAAAPTLWTSLAPNGVPQSAVYTSGAPIVGAANAYTLPAGASISAPEGSVWLCVVDGAVSTAAATVAGDRTTFSFTPNGTGANAGVLTIIPIVDTVATTTPFGYSAVVNVGTGGTSITATAAYVGSVGTLATGLRISYVRLA